MITYLLRRSGKASAATRRQAPLTRSIGGPFEVNVVLAKSDARERRGRLARHDGLYNVVTHRVERDAFSRYFVSEICGS